MTHVQSAEAAGGRLGAVLSSHGPVPARLAPGGPWVTTTLEQARQVLTEPAVFDFPGHVSRGSDLSGSTGDTRSGHSVFAPTTPSDVARGMEVFATQWAAALEASADTTYDVMALLRLPVARATCAAVLPNVPEPARHRVADLVLEWIDALGPVIAARRPPGRWSRARRHETRASTALEQALNEVHPGSGAPHVVATMLAAGTQVPIAAGAWLLVLSAAHPDRAVDPDHVVWETLRLTPPTWITMRVTTQDVRLAGQDIEAGSVVMVSPLLLGRHTALVPGSDEDLSAFDPDRWRTDRSRPGAWLPFGAGAHACPGRNLGLAMLRHLATWAADLQLSLPVDVQVDQSRGIFPSPALVTVAGSTVPR